MQNQDVKIMTQSETSLHNVDPMWNQNNEKGTPVVILFSHLTYTFKPTVGQMTSN